MDLKLNIKDNSIRKKRGKSFFNGEQQTQKLGDKGGHIKISDKIQQPMFMFKEDSYEGELHSSAYISSAAEILKKNKTLNVGLGFGGKQLEPGSSANTKPKGILKNSTQKEIVSAMVRMNT